MCLNLIPSINRGQEKRKRSRCQLSINNATQSISLLPFFAWNSSSESTLITKNQIWSQWNSSISRNWVPVAAHKARRRGRRRRRLRRRRRRMEARRAAAMLRLRGATEGVRQAWKMCRRRTGGRHFRRSPKTGLLLRSWRVRVNRWYRRNLRPKVVPIWPRVTDTIVQTVLKTPGNYSLGFLILVFVRFYFIFFLVVFGWFFNDGWVEKLVLVFGMKGPKEFCIEVLVCLCSVFLLPNLVV